MFANPKSFRCRSVSIFHIVFAGALALSAAFAWAGPVKISFLPPPMEGTLSLGIYDAGGKLVRVLQREAEVDAFTQAADALQTEWDGKDDQGNVLPAGTYRARGVMVGDLGVEGEGYIGNDWVNGEDSPHLARITALKINASGALFLQTSLPGRAGPFVYSVTSKPGATPGEEPEIRLNPESNLPPTVLGRAVPTTIGWNPTLDFGFDSTFWVIENNSVKQYSIHSTVLRTLASQPGDPPAVKLAASPAEEKLYVLYENAAMQRLRGYDFTGAKPGGAPKVMFENDITFSDSYGQIAPKLQFPGGQPFAPSPVLNATLVRNPLFKNKPGALALQAVVAQDGAWIAAADGLPLCRVSDTPHLRWAAMGWPAPKKPITFFDSDGAVVEQFQVSAVARMMAFDAGAHEWTPPAPSPSASPAPSVTPQP